MEEGRDAETLQRAIMFPKVAPPPLGIPIGCPPGDHPILAAPAKGKTPPPVSQPRHARADYSGFGLHPKDGS